MMKLSNVFHQDFQVLLRAKQLQTSLAQSLEKRIFQVVWANDT